MMKAPAQASPDRSASPVFVRHASPRWTLGLLALFLALPAMGQTLEARKLAATTTANNAAECKALTRFYWEIGNASARLASGTRGVLPPSATQQMPIYSSSKWLYGAYAFQRRNGQLSGADVQALTLSSGHTGSGQCLINNTVKACRDVMGAMDPSAVGSFYYAPAHLQQQALDFGLGAMTKTQLATEVRRVLGTDLALTYGQPQLASGVTTSASSYGLFLRKILGGKLLLSGSALGSHAVCTYTGSPSGTGGRTICPKSLYTPNSGFYFTANESWSYSLAHWLEDDPMVGDLSYSSPGYAGFYPWIDSTRTYYGILARNEATLTSAQGSVSCGRKIRKAWATGIAQLS